MPHSDHLPVVLAELAWLRGDSGGVAFKPACPDRCYRKQDLGVECAELRTGPDGSGAITVVTRFAAGPGCWARKASSWLEYR